MRTHLDRSIMIVIGRYFLCGASGRKIPILPYLKLALSPSCILKVSVHFQGIVSAEARLHFNGSSRAQSPPVAGREEAVNRGESLWGWTTVRASPAISGPPHFRMGPGTRFTRKRFFWELYWAAIFSFCDKCQLLNSLHFSAVGNLNTIFNTHFFMWILS